MALYGELIVYRFFITYLNIYIYTFFEWAQVSFKFEYIDIFGFKNILFVSHLSHSFHIPMPTNCAQKLRDAYNHVLTK